MEKTAHITFTLREADGIFAADVETSTPQGIRHTTLYGNSTDPFASYLKLYLDSMDSMQQFLEESATTFHLQLTPADFDIGFDRRATATRQMLQKWSTDGNGGFPTPCDDFPAKLRLSRALILPVLLVCSALAISFLPIFREEHAVFIRQVGGGTLLLTSMFWLAGMACIHTRRACVTFWRWIRRVRQGEPPSNGDAPA